MSTTTNKVQVVVLAAGHGKRMGTNDLPKVLVSFRGKPIIMHLLESIKESGVNGSPVVVVGQQAELVKATLGDGYTYVLQTEQLGTGHAVRATETLLKNKVFNLLVLYGDHPLLKAATIRNIVQTHIQSQATLTMATITVSDYGTWRAGFNDFGRVIRGADGKVEAIVEKKDATVDQLRILEVTPSFFCFRAGWLWDNLGLLKANNVQREYYLTDLVALACKQKVNLATVPVDAREALGVNTPEQLGLLSKLSV